MAASAAKNSARLPNGKPGFCFECAFKYLPDSGGVIDGFDFGVCYGSSEVPNSGNGLL